MRRVNSIRTLEEILRTASNQGSPSHSIGVVITEAMGLSHEPSNIISFFEILSRAEKDVRRLKDEHIQEDIDAIVALQSFLVVSFRWGEPWKKYQEYIDQRGIVRSLKAWANSFSEQSFEPELEDDFLTELETSLTEQLEAVSSSDLSWKVQNLLIRKIEEVLVAVQDCKVYGTYGIRTVARSTLWELERSLEQIPPQDKANSTWQNFWATLVAVDVALGLGANIENFVIPKLISFTEQCAPNVQLLVEDPDSATSVFPDPYDVPKIASGKMLSLAPAKDEEE